MGRTWGFRCGLLVSLLLLTNRATVCADTDCLACHGSTTAVSEAASRLGLAVAPSRLPKLVIQLGQGSVHEGLACTDCHPQAEMVPHPKEMAQQNPCVSCHEEAVAAVNQSAHRDPLGGSSQRAQCWDCHTAHDVRPA
ncbi:MAG: cytochrome c3 family protein, partial [Thermoanaerobaculum sp.]|nr:cytochrome c3 family protein [Thermoanaerobaculum sp.]